MPESPTILLVDDEDAIQKLLTYPLERDGYRVVQARDGEEALRRFAEEEIDLVVLDIMLPKIDGLEVCKRLRAEQHGPDHHAHGSRRRARQGARARARRGRLHHEAVPDPRVPEPRAGRPAARRNARISAGKRDETIDRGDVRIDLPRRTVEVRGEPVQLTFVEFELLALLASNPGVVYSRRQLLERLRGGADYREPRTIDVHVRHLREKIEQEPREPELILTVRGAGYRFRDG